MAAPFEDCFPGARLVAPGKVEGYDVERSGNGAAAAEEADD
jgi:hypothetical protein